MTDLQALQAQVEAAIPRMTKVQEQYVRDGCIHGDCSIRTVTSLRDKGLFHLVVDSPNGQWGFMRLTPLGERARSALIAQGESHDR